MAGSDNGDGEMGLDFGGEEMALVKGNEIVGFGFVGSGEDESILGIDKA